MLFISHLKSKSAMSEQRSVSPPSSSIKPSRKSQTTKHTSCSSSSSVPFFIMGRKPSLFLKQALITLLLLLFALYLFSSSFLSPPLDPNFISHFSYQTPNPYPHSHPHPVKIYLYDLPTKFTYGIIQNHARARGTTPSSDLKSLKYPGHQHMAEWYLFSDLNRPDSERFGSPVVRVSDPEEAELFYVPFFSSLSLIVNTARSAGSESVYSDEETQEELVNWLEDQVYWKRNNGRDHVVIAQDPNALYRAIDRVRNAVLLVSDFGRLRPDQASLVKDVILPYSHRINSYNGEVGTEKRNTLLFFMGNRYRKEGGKIRDLLFQILENEGDILMKHGAQSRESRREASRGMHTSKFCLNPAGDTPSACRLFDSIVSLCVPVIISDNIELPFEDVIDYRKIAIFLDTTSALKPGYLVSMLRKVPHKRILRYQKQMKKVKPYFEYEEGTVNEIWRQISQKLPLIKLMINRDKRVVKRDLSQPDCSCVCSNQTGIRTSL